ncbi:MAG: right-handed parallel beta-helix repeat-containing protein, partial [Verrucomicrobia bacterium]|nr:right-handed parallel beta-helix repeat-containing protein [Verrucomicrobiota bacterium]
LSNGNTIRGLQIVGFTVAGIALERGASDNHIGGDRGIGTGPLGQGNLISGNGDFGIALWDEGTSFNTIQGNSIFSHTRDGIHCNGVSYNLIRDNVIGLNESVGIYLSWVADGHNTVTANFIGTNAGGETPLGNRFAGVLVDQTDSNVIGSGNIIAFNGAGIRFWANTPNNTVTQNSIHDNREPGSYSESRRPGIDVTGAGDPRRISPLILDFDLQAGNLTGLACANCIVELFSDSEDEGGIFENQATADGTGFFSFSKGVAFTGPYLTATATGPDGTTEFSRPTRGTSGITTFQEGNTLAKLRLQTKPSVELAENRISLNYDQLWELDNIGAEDLLEEVTTLGVKRFDTSIHEVESPINWAAGSELSVSATVDLFIDDLIANGVAVNFDLYFWDKDGHANGEELSTPRFQTEEQIQDFLDYVRFIVSHFKGRVQYYTIWGEPDNCGDSPQSGGNIKCIEPLDYINLAEQTIPVIRELDPQAKIGLAPVVLFFGRDWLSTLLESDVIAQFDVIKTHPFYDAAPDIDFANDDGVTFADYYYEYPSLVQDIQQTASAHGFQGEYWGTDLTWWDEGNPNKTLGQPWPSHTETEGVKYMMRVIVMQLGLDGSSGVSVVSNTRWIYPRVRNLTTVMAGASPDSLAVEIESAATNIMSYGFTLPDGERLLALWTNGVAVDDDPGVNTTLTFPGLSASKVTGVDVLDGFEQEMVFETETGDLVIRNLLVKDYPIIVRLAD